MRNKELKIEPLFSREEAITIAIETAEDEMHVLQRYIKDILDEVGDILHDDFIFKKRIMNKALVKPAVREKIREELLSFIIGH